MPTTSSGPTLRQLDAKIRAIDERLAKYRGYVQKLGEEKRALAARRRKLAAAKAKVKAKPAPARRTATTRKKKPTFLDGVLKQVKQSGISAEDILGTILEKTIGNKKEQ